MAVLGCLIVVGSSRESSQIEVRQWNKGLKVKGIVGARRVGGLQWISNSTLTGFEYEIIVEDWRRN